ncbi:MAG: BTAD domain-containing putative transcriptional regulator [Casimicrobiaceae bacterium]
MPTKAAALPAKLSPPRLQLAVSRERLFAWIDAHRGASAIWIGGQPGAGKTILAASYLAQRSLRGIWYRLDADDNDLGRFFATLGQAVNAMGARCKRPVFDAADLAQPHAYARRWFRVVFAALPRPLVLVIDNLEQAALSSLPQVLAAAIDEVPEGVTMLLTSRRAPPPELSRASVSGLLVTLPSEDLDFTAAEAIAFAHAMGLDESAVTSVARRVNGWAAGLRLLSHSHDTTADAADPPLLFDYFAALLHDGLDASGQRLLQVGALLPWIPADLAGRIAGVDNADAELGYLCANNLFTERVADVRGVYRLHPLFHEYLRERALRELGGGERRRIQREAACAFLDRRQPDVAIDLFLDAEDTVSAVRLLLAEAEGKLAAGQLDQFAAWIERLPAAVLDEEPYLRYMVARLCLLREDATTAQHYRQADAVFAARGDLYGRQLCAAGLLEWGYNTDSFTGHRQWAAVLRSSLPATSAVHSEAHALRLLNGRLLASFFGGDFEVEAATLIGDVLDVLAPGGAENEKLFAAVTLLGCLERHKRWDEAQLLAGRMEAMLKSPRVGPRMQILVQQQIAVDLHRQTGAYGDARRLALASRAQAHDHGFAALEFEAVAILLFVALYTGDGAEAAQLARDLAQIVDPGNVYHQRFAHLVRGWIALQGGNLIAAHEHADALRKAVGRSDMPPHFRATWLQLPVQLAFAEGREDLALAELASMCADAEPGSRVTLEVNLLSLQALHALRSGDEMDAAERLGRAWSLAADARYYQMLGPLRASLAELAAFALQHAIAGPFTRELIARRQLRPSSRLNPHWPWPLRIFTLGRFAVHVDGQPLKFEGKVPKKPLALLKALIAFGCSEVPEHKLTDALWPDDEADAAHAAFNVALHRLRKLIPGGVDRLRLQDGRLSLDPAACWTDCEAFEQLVSDTAAGRGDGVRETEPLRRALELYQGRFLAEDTNEPWSVSKRERLRGKFNRAVMSRGAELSAAGRDAEAIECYRRGLDTDDLAEEFYQGLMRSALRLQRPAEGIAAYQRLQRMLSMLLGIAPSAETEALRRQLTR